MKNLPGTTRLFTILAISGAFLTSFCEGADNGVDHPTVGPDSLGDAIAHLARTYGDKYPRGPAFLKRLKEAGTDANAQAGLEQLQREALTAHPLLEGRPVLFICRHQYRKDHHNTATLFQTGEINTRSFHPGGPMKAITFRAGRKSERVVFDPGKEGLARDPEVSFDGRRIVFSLRRNIKEDYHIYEIPSDSPRPLKAGGEGVAQLTRAAGVSDIDPLYLPDGGIVFSSTREPKYCMCNRHIMANLFKMEADGANIHQIGKSTLFEGHSSLTPDGRILYDRWEYVDRNFGDAQGLWTVNPDGTAHSIFWGNNTASPGGVIDARTIPGSGHCLAVLATCHDRPWGALAVIDRSKGIDGPEPVLHTWPESAKAKITIEGTGRWDSLMKVFPKYEDPYPLDENFFLVSRTLDRERTGIFLVDLFGNELLLHEEKDWGCFDPMPVSPRFKPPVLPDGRDLASKTGKFYVHNVYEGTHMEDVKPGEIGFLRVVESPEKRNWIHPNWGGQGSQSPAVNWHSFEIKRILGTVPVEKDGSVYFEVPSDTFVYFQLLDTNRMMVQSMRSGTIVAPGETQGCVGCHENRVEAPLVTNSPLALRRPPGKMAGPKGATEVFSYMKTVQPVWDKHCVSCHDFDQPAGEKLVLARDRTLSFNASYIDLWSRGYITCPGGGPAAHMPAKSWGSHASPLVEVLRKGHPDHKDVRLSRKEMEAIVTWIDLNAPYYPAYECAYPANPTGRSPLTNQQVQELRKLTKTKFISRHGRNLRAQICFDRPKMSPCLKGLDMDTPAYEQALALITAGRDQLKTTPRADMAGFVASESDRLHIEKYEKRAAIEKQVRAAMVEGKKVYDGE